jgi:hypothetical protein
VVVGFSGHQSQTSGEMAGPSPNFIALNIISLN